VDVGQGTGVSTSDRFAVGVAQLGGVLLSIVGVMQLLQGSAAVANDGAFVEGTGHTLDVDASIWGWLHIATGVLALAIGIAIVAGHVLGYLGGIGAAFLGAVVNFTFIPNVPVWAILNISLNVLVIWALCRQISRGRVGDDYYDDDRRDAVTGSAR
jgi:hypothetical protein